MGDWLEEATGHDNVYWVSRVQNAIANHTKPSKKHKGHGETKTRRAIIEILDEVLACDPVDQLHDGNMRTAAVLGMVLTLWFTRVQRAKCWSPLRPISVRRRAYRFWLDYQVGLFSNTMDERRDSVHFPGQPWQSPWIPKAKSGDFI